MCFSTSFPLSHHCQPGRFFCFWDKENIYWLKMPWSLINTDVISWNYITSKHLYIYLFFEFEIPNFSFYLGHLDSPFQFEIIFSAERLLCRGWMTLPPFSCHNLGTTILIRAWGAEEELFYLHLSLSFKGKMSLWQRQDRHGRWEDSWLMEIQDWILTQGSDPDLSLPPEYPLGSMAWVLVSPVRSFTLSLIT